MYATLKSAFRPYVGRLALLAGTSIVSALFEVLTLATLIPLIQAITQDGVFRSKLRFLSEPVSLSVRVLITICLVAIVGRTSVQLLGAFLGARLATAYEASRRRELFGAFLDSNWALQSREKGGRLQLLMVENVAHGTGALRSVALGIVASCNFLILFVSAFFIDTLGALAIAVVAGLLFLVTRPLSKHARHLSQEKAKFNTRFAGEVNQTVRIAREVRVFNAAGPLKSIAGGVIEQVRRSRFLALLSNAALPALYQNAAGLIVVGGLGVVYYSGGGRLATLSAVALLLIRALTYSQNFQTVHHHVTEGLPFLEQMAEIELDYKAAATADKGDKLTGIDHLAFNDVCFAYNPPDLTLKHLSFEIPRGEVVGVAGPSGSGKSTLIQLFLRLRQPLTGEILVNGRRLDAFTLSSWFDRVSYVPQEPQLIAATLAENIAFYRPWATPEKIERAAKLAGIHDEILALPRGYATDAGEAGGSLSGGQRQRICIARALLGEPDFIIFDEPTSSLDVHSEARIQETLLGLKGKVTLLIIAHRLSTLSICDRIMVLKEGAIAAFASAEVLAETDPYYGDALRLARKGTA
ncbi:MAG: ABC transporter ATP-binding protein/permease [Planctomycetes bacterium]|nr:ABC transporter ATP-binding protein/permease [Planctomycetota bacterium]